jgi:hypothetical protein
MRFALLFCWFSTSLFAAEVEFDRQIAPLLARRCLDCHSGDDAQGGLNLTQKKMVLAGDAPVIIAGKIEESRLWERIDGDEMPPKKPLTKVEKELIREWIQKGAKWGEDPINPFRFTTDYRAGADWWSLQPLTRVIPPRSVVTDINPIDAFLRVKREAKILQANPEADRRTLIRRLSFDLLGLPPTPEEVQAFLVDTRPDAYERLVDRYLTSPHYGERWARHWLDLVRFGESDGFERDLPRFQAWPYRDWVIQALNQDVPYNRFVQMQIAGDAITSEDPEVMKAVGFLVAGPHDIVVPASERMKQTMKQDELEELIGTVGQTFLGLTINCARCHDHKFDPISQKDYYRLVASLQGVQPAERVVIAEKLASQLKAIHFQLKDVDTQIEGFETFAEQRLRSKDGKTLDRPAPFAEWDFRKGLVDVKRSLEFKLRGTATVTIDGLLLDGKSGYAITAPIQERWTEKTLEAWVKLSDLNQRGGGVVALQSLDGSKFDAIVFGELEPRKWIAGSEGFRRTKPVIMQNEAAAKDRFIHIAVTSSKNGEIRIYREGKLQGQAYTPGPIQSFEPKEAVFTVGIRHEPAGTGKLLSGVVQRVRIYNRELTADEIAASSEVHFTEAQIASALNESERKTYLELREKRTKITAERDRIRTTSEEKVYTLQPGALQPTHVLLRGSVDAKGEALEPGPVQVLAKPWPTSRTEPDNEANRRKRLAEWVTSSENPLFSRVVVNRLWQHHFATGLVDSANDFGFNGGRPTHPELLDWLAQQLITQNYSLKSMHRLMVTSATYRQSSLDHPENRSRDADNRFLWRITPKRLEAESVRDAILTTSGLLQPQIGGKSFQDFKTFFFKGTQFYDPIDQVMPETHRRTVYRMWARGGRSPFLDNFDCPDPSTITPKRASTTTPLQALSLMNNAFVLFVSETLAKSIEAETLDGSKRVQRLYQQLYQREPEDRELALAVPFVEKHGLPALTRVLLNSAEFSHLD